jgi:hypothetical protein
LGFSAAVRTGVVVKHDLDDVWIAVGELDVVAKADLVVEVEEVAEIFLEPGDDGTVVLTARENE